jgi:hypothetical protein
LFSDFFQRESDGAVGGHGRVATEAFARSRRHRDEVQSRYRSCAILLISVQPIVRVATIQQPFGEGEKFFKSVWSQSFACRAVAANPI